MKVISTQNTLSCRKCGYADFCMSTIFSAEDKGNYAQQTSLHAACEGNFANIVVDLLAAGLKKHSMYFNVF